MPFGFAFAKNAGRRALTYNFALKYTSFLPYLKHYLSAYCIQCILHVDHFSFRCFTRQPSADATRARPLLKQTNKPMTHKLLLAGFALGLLTSAHAQTNPIDSFFHANYNVPNLAEYASRQVGQVSYVLVNESEYVNVQQRYLDGSYVKLGESGYESWSGVPDREAAIAYARFIGADAVVYACSSFFDQNRQLERTNHTIGFYAHKQAGRVVAVQNFSQVLSNQQATTAFSWLQDTLNKPHVKIVSYDAGTDSYTWIGPKYRRQMSMARTQFLAEIWSGYLKFGVQ